MYWYPDGLGDPQCLRFSNLRDAEGIRGHGNNEPRTLHLFVSAQPWCVLQEWHRLSLL